MYSYHNNYFEMILRNISLTIPIELLNGIDKRRGDIPRSKFILRLLESKMDSPVQVHNDKKMIPIDASFEAKNQQVPGLPE